MTCTKIILLCIFISTPALSKSFLDPGRDSLSKKSFSYFVDKLERQETKAGETVLYATAYLQKAKQEQDWKEVRNAYKYLLHQASRGEQLEYADSIVSSAIKTKDVAQIGASYMTRGIIHFSNKQYTHALNNYLKANDYILRTKDTYLQYKIRFNIGQIKYYLGYYNEALIIFDDCVKFYNVTDNLAYLYALHAQGLCNNKLGNFDKASAINQLGIAEANATGELEPLPYFILSEGINQFHRGNFQLARFNMEQAIPQLKAYDDFASIVVANFYIGKCYWKDQNYEKALPYFFEVDRVYKEKNYIHPDLREAYELIISYYKDRNTKTFVRYITKLQDVDRMLYRDYRYLVGKMAKEYDFQELRSEKQKAEKQLQHSDNKNTSLIVLSAFFVVLSLWLTYRHHRNKKYYRQKFEEFMESKSIPKPKPKIQNIESGDGVAIPQQTVAEILGKLEAFEVSGKVTGKDLSLKALAKILDTNTKYLAAVISQYRNKSYPAYINDLKIDFIIDLLEKETRFRNYTYEALADRVGIATASRFSRAFSAKTGMTPIMFVKVLKEKEVS